MHISTNKQTQLQHLPHHQTTTLLCFHFPPRDHIIEVLFLVIKDKKKDKMCTTINGVEQSKDVRVVGGWLDEEGHETSQEAGNDAAVEEQVLDIGKA